jgi:hypothetical protein
VVIWPRVIRGAVCCLRIVVVAVLWRCCGVYCDGAALHTGVQCHLSLPLYSTSSVSYISFTVY